MGYKIWVTNVIHCALFFLFFNHKLLPVWTNNQFLSGSGDNLVQYAEGKRLVLS